MTGGASRNDATAAFFDGTARGELLIKRCSRGHFSRPQAEHCPQCGSTELEDTPASGSAKLVSWAVVHGRPREGQPPPEPVVPAIVELQEGPWWWSQLVGVDPAALGEGQPLRVDFERPEGSEAIPVFRPA